MNNLHNSKEFELVGLHFGKFGYKLIAEQVAADNLPNSPILVPHHIFAL